MKTKNRLSLIITALAFVSCTDDVSDLALVDQLSQENNSRSYSEAFIVAQNSISLLSSTTTRSGFASREIDTTKTRAITRPVTRDGSVENDTIIYVFNFKDNNGFALVSASLATEELLAVTEKGNYFPSQPSEIEGFNEFVELAANYVRTASDIGLRKPYPHGPVVYKDSIVVTYEELYPSLYEPPYKPINWEQEIPEGEFCDNNLAGCVNTAIGEIMMFFSYPTSIQLTYPNADKSMEILNWQNVRNHEPPCFIPFCNDTATHYSIGRLVRQIGYLTDSDYEDYTKTSKNDIKPALEELGFSVGNWINYSRLSILSDMCDRHIFMVCGQKNSLEGHAWLLDHMIKKIATTYELYLTAMGWVPTGVVHTTTSYLLHYNWGSYGSCNGYFNENVYTMSEEEISDNTGGMINGPSYNINTQFLSVSVNNY